MMIQGFPVIDEDTSRLHFGATGYEGRDTSAYPRSSLKCCKEGDGQRYPKSSYEAMIAAKTAAKSWIRDKLDRCGLPVKDQMSSNYCWGHAPVRGVEAVIAKQGGKLESLSAFDVCTAIKDGRNHGGSGIEAVEWIAENGVCLEKYHKPMDFSVGRSAEAREDAMRRQIVVYEDMDPDDKDLIIAKLLDDKAVTVGIPAWGHEVLLTFLVWENAEPLFGFDNSWGRTWGTNGRGVLRGRMSNFDEAGSIEVVEVS